MVTASELLATVQDYDLFKVCFTDFINWVFREDSENLRRYDLITLIQGPQASEFLTQFEADLSAA